MSAPVTTAAPDRLVVATTSVLLVTAGVVVVAGLLAATGATVPGTLGDPGPLTTTGLPVARYLQDVVGVLVVGCAVLPVLRGEGAVADRARRLLGPLAVAWAAVTALVYVLTASDLSGRPVPRILTVEVQQVFLTLDQARAQLLVVLAAVVLLVASRTAGGRARGTAAGGSPWVARGVLAVATAGLLPPAFVGHSASAADHETAVASVSVHLVAGAMWVGGLAVLAVLVLADRRVDAGEALPVVAAYSTLALGCVVVVGASGVLNGALRVGPGDLVTSAYGLLLLAKTAGLVALVGFGWWHRRRSVAGLAAAAGSARTGGAAWSAAARGAFARLVVVELAVMALTVAAAVVLARTPPPGVPGA